MQSCMSTLLTIALLFSFANLEARGEDTVLTAASAPQCMLSIRGEKGQKGDPGKIPDLIGFTVRRSSSFSSNNRSNRFPFQEFVTRSGVDNFDLNTGTFKCSVPGFYFFTFAVFKPLRTNQCYAYLRKNGDIVATAASDAASGDNTNSANSAILLLQQGDEVYLTLWGSVFESSNHYNTFSGFLLSEV